MDFGNNQESIKDCMLILKNYYPQHIIDILETLLISNKFDQEKLDEQFKILRYTMINLTDNENNINEIIEQRLLELVNVIK